MSQKAVRGRRPLHGFSRVEPPVVIAIVGVLVALLLPAIQAVRGAAPFVLHQQSAQLALAMHNYENSIKHYPPNFCWTRNLMNKGAGRSGFGACCRTWKSRTFTSSSIFRWPTPMCSCRMAPS